MSQVRAELPAGKGDQTRHLDPLPRRNAGGGAAAFEPQRLTKPELGHPAASEWVTDERPADPEGRVPSERLPLGVGCQRSFHSDGPPARAKQERPRDPILMDALPAGTQQDEACDQQRHAPDARPRAAPVPPHDHQATAGQQARAQHDPRHRPRLGRSRTGEEDARPER